MYDCPYCQEIVLGRSNSTLLVYQHPRSLFCLSYPLIRIIEIGFDFLVEGNNFFSRHLIVLVRTHHCLLCIDRPLGQLSGDSNSSLSCQFLWESVKHLWRGPKRNSGRFLSNLGDLLLNYPCVDRLRISACRLSLSSTVCAPILSSVPIEPTP